MLKIYTKTVCPKCMLVKSELDRKKIPYESINIDTDDKAKALLVENNFMAVPVVDFDGELVVDYGEIMENIEKISA